MRERFGSVLLVNKTWGDVPLWKENGLGPEIESWGQSAGAVGSGSGRRDDMGVQLHRQQGVITISGPSISHQGPFCQFQPRCQILPGKP